MTVDVAQGIVLAAGPHEWPLQSLGDSVVAHLWRKEAQWSRSANVPVEEGVEEALWLRVRGVGGECCGKNHLEWGT
jgi:hypothetical protein